MKIEPIDIIKSMSGKVCRHSDTSISLNSSSGRMHTSKLCNPYTGPASAKQIAQQQAFKLRAEKVSAWLNANKPSAANGDKGTEAYQEAMRVKKSLALSNVRQVICRYMDASGKVTLPSGNESASAPSGGGSSTPSGGGSGDGI